MHTSILSSPSQPSPILDPYSTMGRSPRTWNLPPIRGTIPIPRPQDEDKGLVLHYGDLPRVTKVGQMKYSDLSSGVTSSKKFDQDKFDEA